MLKNKYLILLIIFSVLLIILVISRNSQKQNLKLAPLKTISLVESNILPSQTVINFYDTYLLYKGNLLSINAYGNSPYLTSELKSNLKTEISKNMKFNPILCSLENPTQIKIHLATVSSKLAEVLVTETFKNKSQDLSVKLLPASHSYLINQIICK